MPEYVSYTARVLKWSTIRVDSRTYSVPSRLIGVMVDVRLYPDHVEVYYKGHGESMERIRGKGKARIDYRHIIGSWCASPERSRATASGSSCIPRRTPSVWHTTRCAAGRESEPTWTTSGYCILAATTMECEVERALKRLLESSVRFDYPVVKQLAAPVLRRYRHLSCPVRWTWACTTGCLREVRDDD